MFYTGGLTPRRSPQNRLNLMETTPAGLAAAQFHRLAGDLDRARQEYGRLLEAEPNRVEALHGLGGIAYQLGEHDRAVEWLGRAVAVQPDNPLLHSNLGAAYRAAGRLTEAEACYRQALRLQPDLAQAYNNLANVLKEQGKREEAAARCWQAVLASPNYAEAHHNLGLILWEQGELEEALDQLRFAAQLRRTSPRSMAARASCCASWAGRRRRRSVCARRCG